jgi:hypothetical protein
MNEPIGGFFELETGAGRGAYHTTAPALCSGRACLRLILESLRPSRVWAPFYVCDAALQAFRAAGVPVELYAIDEALDPMLPAGVPGAGECLVYVNYFGLKTSTAGSLVAAHPGRVIVDDTHAFFAKGYAAGWSFNSARKFFGVPDGGYVYGAGLPAVEYPRVPEVYYDHLVNRVLGRQDLAYEQYLRSEAQFTADVWRISALSERLLASVEYDAVCDRRRRNFAALAAKFGSRNCLTSRLGSQPAHRGEVPFCYPLLSSEPVPWTALWSRKMFVPRLWPEVPERARSSEFPRESLLAERLLPLPIDQRYGAEDLDRLADIVTEVMGW